MFQFALYIYTVGTFTFFFHIYNIYVKKKKEEKKREKEKNIQIFLPPWNENVWLTIDYHFRKCKRPVGEETEENKKGKRKRAAEIEIEEVSTKDKEVSVVAETKRKTMEHTVTRCDARLPKVTPITDDYEISNHVLGLGINGKVVQCYDKNTREKYALKVRSAANASLSCQVHHFAHVKGFWY